MAVDLRVGKTDHFVRYKVFGRDYDFKAGIKSSQQAIGIFYGKDVSAYSNELNAINNRFGRTSITAQIETYDIVKLEVGLILYNTQYRTWWIIDSFTEETINTSEQNSTRPISKKVITIRNGG